MEFLSTSSSWRPLHSPAESEEFSLRNDWRERRQRLYPSYGGVLQGIEGEHFLQAVALLKTQADRREAIERGQPANRLPAISCKRRDILNLDLPDYQKWADEVEEGFRKAAAFLQSQFIFGRHNVPYNTQLTPLSALYVELGGELEPALAREKLARWYWSGIFGDRVRRNHRNPICSGPGSSRGVCQRGCRAYPDYPGQLHT